jgi:Leucine-rich repeat (LRR) protein
MEPEPKLLEAFLRFGGVGVLDKATQAALRLCNNQIKKVIDATVVSCTVTSADVALICSCDWRLKELIIEGTWSEKSLGNEDTVLPKALVKKFSLLEKLKIQGCLQLEALPGNIGELIHLQDIKICSVNKLAALPRSLWQLTSVELYNCWDLTLEGLAPLKQLHRLKTLDIGGWEPEGASSLPEWVCDNIITRLLDLRLRDTDLPLPSTISNFKHLTSLMIDDSRAYELPDSIGLLSSLQKLDIVSVSDSRNKLPDSFSMLSALKELDLSVKLEDIALLQHLTGLTHLNLEYYRGDGYLNLDVIWNLTLLKNLRLYDKTVEPIQDYSLSDDIAKLENLESLCLNYIQKLHELPESIGNLSCLTELNLSGTGVKSLPDAIGKLNALKELILIDCYGLTELPESFADRVLGKDYEDWSLELVIIRGCPTLELSPKMEQAMELLRSRGMLIEE